MAATLGTLSTDPGLLVFPLSVGPGCILLESRFMMVQKLEGLDTNLVRRKEDGPGDRDHQGVADAFMCEQRCRFILSSLIEGAVCKLLGEFLFAF
jgi:hypothetical protein